MKESLGKGIKTAGLEAFWFQFDYTRSPETLAHCFEGLNGHQTIALGCD